MIASLITEMPRLPSAQVMTSGVGAWYTGGDRGRPDDLGAFEAAMRGQVARVGGHPDEDDPPGGRESWSAHAAGLRRRQVQLEERDSELAAARGANRELMAQLNAARHQ